MGSNLKASSAGSVTKRRAFILCLLVATCALIVAPSAQASLGIDAFWGSKGGSEADGGRFQTNGPRGVAIYEATGDVYVADTGFHRIQVFDEDGNFKAAWGFDVDSVNPSTAFEICTEKANCKTGVNSVSPAPGGEFSNPSAIAVNQTNGHVYVNDVSFNRVQEFTAAGAFVRAFGQDVVSAGPDNAGTGFEVCIAANGDTCKTGTTTGDLGGVINSPTGENVASLTVAPAGAPNAGDVLIADPNRRRVQEFTAAGAFVRAFGWDVVQPGGSGASMINEQQKITVDPGLTGGAFTLSWTPAGGSAQTTAAIPAGAEASAVEAALAALAGIGAAANVDVSGPAGGPFTVEFTGALADNNVNQISIGAGSLPVGTGLNCSSSTTAETTSIQWLANGEPIVGATGSSYTLAAGDAGKSVQCRVFKANGTAGSVQTSFNPLPVASTPSGPLPTPPVGNITLTSSPANPVVGTVVTCPAGTWANSPTSYTYTWLRNGSTVMETETKAATSDTYAVKAEDVPSNIQCVVTASNANGSASKASQNKVTASFGGSSPGGNTGAIAVSVPLPSGTVTTLQEGSAAFEVCVAAAQCKAGSPAGDGVGRFAETTPTRVAEDPSGRIYTVERTGTATGAPLVRTSGFRVQSFGLSGSVLTAQGTFDCADLCGTRSGVVSASDNPVDVAVDAQGAVYVQKVVPEGTGEPEVPVVVGVGEHYQERILKIDPAGNGGSGQVVESMIGNPGEEPGVEGDISVAVRVKGISGLAVTGSGSRLYFSTTGTQRSRVYRMSQISGPSGSVTTDSVGATAVNLDATIQPAETLGNVKTLYRFEYRREGTLGWIASPNVDLNVGNGSAGGESSECSPAVEAAICHVSGEIDGLEVGRTYQYRLVARTTYQGAAFTTAPQEFTTAPVPPSVKTGSAVWSGPPSTSPSLTFVGQVNPQGANTGYSFEYVTQAEFDVSEFADAQIAPASPVSAGHGTKTIDVTVAKNGLDPTSSYRFRLVATNPSGTATGIEGSVAPPHGGDRFIELVSQGDSQAGDVSSVHTAISDDGERASFTAITFGDEQQAAPWIISPAIGQRGAAGWQSTAVGGDPESTGSSSWDVEGGIGDAAVTRRLWSTVPAPQTMQFSARKLDGTLEPITPVMSPLDRVGFFGLDYKGGSPDLSTLVFSSTSATQFPDEQPLNGASNLYEVSDAGTDAAAVSLVNRDGGGIIGGACGATLGSTSLKTNAVSADGSVVYFSARPEAPATGSCDTTKPLRIFKRVEGLSTVEVSSCAKTAPGNCSGGDDLYLGASANGTKVFFSTSRQLTDSDADSTSDLYLYDSAPPAGEPNLVQVSAGELVPGAPPAHEVGKGAEVLGLVDLAMDGSRVYFVAKGQLTAEGNPGGNNVYVYQRDDAHPAGRIDFVATVAPEITPIIGDSSGDPRLWAANGNSTGGGKPAYALPRYEGSGVSRADGDGHLLVFITKQPLLPAEDADSSNDLYRYDDEAGELECLSCVGDAAVPVNIIGRNVAFGQPDQIQRERVASEDGSEVVFSTREKLLPADSNATAEDVYMWDEGTLSLISGATSDSGVSYFEFGGGPAISPDGDTVLFSTRATILPQDGDNGATDIYAARIDGGFRQEETTSDCASEDACRAPLPAETPPASSPGSATFAGAGNVKTKCAKKKVLRGNRCVKPKHKHKKHKRGKGKKQSRDGSGRRAGR